MVSGAGPVIAQTQLPYTPYYQQSTNKVERCCRSIRIPNSNDYATIIETGTSPAPPWNEGYYILLSGFSASAQVINVMVTFTYEFAPAASSTILSPVDFSMPGVATDRAIATMLRSFPMI